MSISLRMTIFLRVFSSLKAVFILLLTCSIGINSFLTLSSIAFFKFYVKSLLEKLYLPLSFELGSSLRSYFSLMIASRDCSSILLVTAFGSTIMKSKGIGFPSLMILSLYCWNILLRSVYFSNIFSIIENGNSYKIEAVENLRYTTPCSSIKKVL